MRIAVRSSFGSTSSRLIALALLALVVLALLLNASTASTEAPSVAPTLGTTPAASPTPSSSLDLDGAEQKVLAVLETIDRTGEAPAGYRGGGTFMNDGRGGGEVLPRRDASGVPITYREWDVNPYTGANRGAERLVTGSDGSAWYTADHYDTFVRVR